VGLIDKPHPSQGGGVFYVIDQILALKDLLMPNYQAISSTTHASQRWKRFDHYHFAAKDAVAPLVVQELHKAVMALPLAFIEQEGGCTPVAVLGLQNGQNLFVTPDGRWLGGYTPATYRGHPFALASTPEAQLMLCVDADSGLVGPEGEDFEETFFDEQGQPSQAVKAVLQFLEQVRANRQPTERLCALLAQEGLIQPWPISVKADNGEQAIEGLHRIDEAKLNALGADALHRLHQAGALPLIYCQLLSMQHLPLLGKLAQAHAKAKAQAQAQANAPLDFEQLLHASAALADAKPGKGKRGKGANGRGANGKGMNGYDADDLNWSL
jgi:hypothetical protein